MAQKKQKSFSKKSVQKLLTSLVFDPKEPGPLKVILDVDNQSYFLHRSMEELQTALTHPEQLRLSRVNLERAIRLLSIAILRIDQRLEADKAESDRLVKISEAQKPGIDNSYVPWDDLSDEAKNGIRTQFAEYRGPVVYMSANDWYFDGGQWRWRPNGRTTEANSESPKT